MFKFRRMYLRFMYNQDGGAGAGTGQGAGQGQGAGDGGAGQGAGQGQGQGAGQGQGQGAGQNQPFATFPDEASFMARMNREGKKQLETMAKELGYETVEAMQDAAKAKKEADNKAKSDLDKEKERANKAENEKKIALEAANTRLINAEIKVIASEMSFVDKDDAVALVDRANIQVDDKGNVTGVKEAVEALAKVKPHLIGQGGGKPGGSPGGAGNGGRQDGGGANPIEDAKKFAEDRNKGQQAASGGYDPWAQK